tara:strand:- start:32 stop:601 length:570 start_codon:yes stop_codon:yes gene_type:complete
MTKEERKVYNKEYVLKNKEKLRELRKIYNKENREKIQTFQKIYNKKYWREKYGEFEYKGEEHRREYMKNYMKEYNIKYPHIQRSKRLLNDVLRRMGKTKTSPTSKLLGYSAIDLKEHLDALGMDWGKHQINHRIPVSWFHVDTPMHIISDLRNLEPSTRQENLAQSNKYCILPCKEYINIAKKYLLDAV